MQLATGDLETELAITRRMLERVPDAHFAWKPHEKSMSLGALATHLANLLFWQRITLDQDEFDLATFSGRSPLPETTQALLALFDKNLAALRAVLEQVDETTLSEPWTLKRDGRVLFTMPKATILRRFGVSHMVHHRGQLTVYLRLLGVPVPPSFGPTADEST